MREHRTTPLNSVQLEPTTADGKFAKHGKLSVESRPMQAADMPSRKLQSKSITPLAPAFSAKYSSNELCLATSIRTANRENAIAVRLIGFPVQPLSFVQMTIPFGGAWKQSRED